MTCGLTTNRGRWAAFLVVVAAVPVAAQTHDPGASAPRVELDGGVGAAVGGGPLLETGLRVHLTRTVGVGVSAEWAGPKGGGYVIDVRWMPDDVHGRVRPFLTGGLLGTFKFESSPGSQRVLAGTGDIVTYAPFHDLKISGVESGVAGGGVRIPVGPHAAFEAFGQVWIGTFRPSPAFVGGVRLTIGLGGVAR